MRLRYLAIFLAAASACKTKSPVTQAVAPVRVAAAVQRDVPRVLEATGTVEPVRTARVEAQVSGLIDKVTFREGDQRPLPLEEIVKNGNGGGILQAVGAK